MHRLGEHLKARFFADSSQVSGKDKGVRARHLTRQVFSQFDAIAIRQMHINQEDLGTAILHMLAGGAGGIYSFSLVAEIAKDEYQGFNNIGFVVYYQNSCTFRVTEHCSIPPEKVGRNHSTLDGPNYKCSHGFESHCSGWKALDRGRLLCNG